MLLLLLEAPLMIYVLIVLSAHALFVELRHVYVRRSVRGLLELVKLHEQRFQRLERWGRPS